MTQSKDTRRIKIKRRISSKVRGDQQKPRLSVFRSNTEIYAQLIDDIQGITLVAASSVKIKEKKTNTEKAKKVGQMIAQLALEKGFKACRFDRNGYLYHGRVKALAEGAREGGLTI